MCHWGPYNVTHGASKGTSIIEKHLLTLPEFLCELDGVMAPPHGQSDNTSSNCLNTTNYGELLARQNHVVYRTTIILIQFPPQPVVTELDVERLPAVAVKELGIHSQAHLLVMDLQVQTKNEFSFLLMCHVSTVGQFTSVT